VVQDCFDERASRGRLPLDGPPRAPLHPAGRLPSPPPRSPLCWLFEGVPSGPLPFCAVLRCDVLSNLNPFPDAGDPRCFQEQAASSGCPLVLVLLQSTFLHKGFDETRRLGLTHDTEAEVREAVPATETGMLVVDSRGPGGPAAAPGAWRHPVQG